MALNERRDFHAKVECECSQISIHDKLMTSIGSIYDHFPLSTLARGAMRISCFQKEFRTMWILIFKKCFEAADNGLERVRHGSPWADIRRGGSYKLSDASGRLPDAI